MERGRGGFVIYTIYPACGIASVAHRVRRGRFFGLLCGGNVRRLALMVTAASLVTGQAFANDVGENAGWQFHTTADKANLAAIQDMIQRKRSGYYAAPTYTTTIDHQYNCTLSAAATGNQGTASAVANSPATSGATATSTGNSNGSTIDGFGLGSAGSAASNSDQANNGTVRAGIDGSTSSSVRGSASQVLNSTQSNSGTQSANASGATGCSFAGALN